MRKGKNRKPKFHDLDWKREFLGIKSVKLETSEIFWKYGLKYDVLVIIHLRKSILVREEAH